jgi:glycosyltransferase involved in cell wall biosynthesis
LKIALDATYSLDPNLSGVGVYSHEVLYGLAAAHPEAGYLFCYRPHRYLRSFSSRLPEGCRRSLLWKDRPSSADLFHGLNQRIHSPSYRRTVSTFHDLFVMTGEYSTLEFRQKFSAQARTAAERSDLIVTVSRFTAGQVEALLHIDPARIRVIPHGTRRVSPDATRPKREPMILFVGAIQRRKNVARLIEAFEQVVSGWTLVLAGSIGFGAEEALQRIEASPRKQDIRVLGYVSGAVLEDLYWRASIFAFPSLDEGFGMPVLDAMAHGLPVLTSNVSALPEVAGDAAWLVDPADPTSIAQGLSQLIEGEGLRERLTRQGLARSAGFTWEKTVEETWKVYQELLR